MVDSQYAVIQKLRWIRAQNYLTQEEVAKRMGACVATVVRIESGDFDLRVSTLRRYALACGGEIASPFSRVNQYRSPAPLGGTLINIKSGRPTSAA